MSAIGELIDAGGPVMWLIVVDCVVVWALLGERMLTLYGRQFTRKERAKRFDPSKSEKRRALVTEGMETRAERAAMAERVRLTRHFALIRSLIAIAPLLGLLGTVSGMIVTFDGILLGKRMSAASMGIAEALLTTQFGLAVVVPALVVERILARRSAKLAEARMLQVAYLRKNLLAISSEDVRTRVGSKGGRS